MTSDIDVLIPDIGSIELSTGDVLRFHKFKWKQTKEVLEILRTYFVVITNPTDANLKILLSGFGSQLPKDIETLVGIATGKARKIITKELVKAPSDLLDSVDLANSHITELSALTNNDGSITYVEGVDYNWDELGNITFPEQTNITASQQLRASYIESEIEQILNNLSFDEAVNVFREAIKVNTNFFKEQFKEILQKPVEAMTGE